MASGIKIGALRKRRTENESVITLDFGEDGTLNLTVDPSRITVGWVKDISAAGRNNDFGIVTERFFEVVKDWDLLDDDGEKMPFNDETVDALGFDIFYEMAVQMGKQYAQTTETSSS